MANPLFSLWRELRRPRLQQVEQKAVGQQRNLGLGHGIGIDTFSIPFCKSVHLYFLFDSPNNNKSEKNKASDQGRLI